MHPCRYCFWAVVVTNPVILRYWPGLHPGVWHLLRAGVAECHAIVAEFDRCRAGGLPPPSRIPTPEELAKEAEDKKIESEMSEPVLPPNVLQALVL